MILRSIPNPVPGLRTMAANTSADRPRERSVGRAPGNFACISPRNLFGGSEHTDTPALSFNGTAVARRNGFNSRQRVPVRDDSPPISFGGSECAVPSVNALVARRESRFNSCSSWQRQDGGIHPVHGFGASLLRTPPSAAPSPLRDVSSDSLRGQ